MATGGGIVGVGMGRMVTPPTGVPGSTPTDGPGRGRVAFRRARIRSLRSGMPG